MGQLGFFDADKRLQALSARGDPLEAIDHLVPWESFRAEIEAVVLTPDELKKSSAGRKPFDAILMFRMLVLQALNNLSDEQVEYQVRDRLSFSRFLGLAIEDSIPDATTLWLFREKLAKAEMIEKLFDRFEQRCWPPDRTAQHERRHMWIVIWPTDNRRKFMKYLAVGNPSKRAFPYGHGGRVRVVCTGKLGCC